MGKKQRSKITKKYLKNSPPKKQTKIEKTRKSENRETTM